MKIRLTRAYGGHYTFKYCAGDFAIAYIRRGHWEMLLNGDYYDTACSLGEARALIWLFLKDNE